MSKLSVAVLWMGVGSVGTLVATSLLTRTPTMAEGRPAPDSAVIVVGTALPAGTSVAAGPRSACPCPGDFNGDNAINSIDLTAFLSVFGTVCCIDADICTVDEVIGGVCVHTPVVCNDNNPCTNDICNPATGCVFMPNTNACDDGNPCTGHDRCVNGVCIGTPLICNDGDPCTDDVCINGDCVFISNCQPSNACYSASCNPNTHECTQVYLCNDNNPCTNDICNPATGCVHTSMPSGSRCDDGNPCTVNDQCINGVCIGTPISCPPGQVCNPATGGCQTVP